MDQRILLGSNALLPIESASEEIALLASSDNVVALKIDELTVGVADLDKNIVLDASGKKYQINCPRRQSQRIAGTFR